MVRDGGCIISAFKKRGVGGLLFEELGIDSFLQMDSSLLLDTW